MNFITPLLKYKRYKKIYEYIILGAPPRRKTLRQRLVIIC